MRRRLPTPVPRQTAIFALALFLGYLIGRWYDEHWGLWWAPKIGRSGSLQNPLSPLDTQYIIETKTLIDEWNQLDELIMVAGHAIYTAPNYDHPADDASWSLEPYQKGQAATFIAHIREGIRLAALNPRALLVFSGGETRYQAGPINQAISYWQIAEHAQWYGTSAVRTRATTEMYARDSYDNLLFSICRFRELTGQYPHRIVVVGFTFKKERFIQLHRHAIRYPISRFEYVGIDPPSVKEASIGEQQKSFAPFEADPYSCHAELRIKKEGRNPFRRSIAGYADACPEIRDLLYYCGPTLFPHKLPWIEVGWWNQHKT